MFRAEQGVQHPVGSQFLRFGIVGSLGFIVDVTVLYLMLTVGAGFATGRLVSFFCAVTFTWYLNRHFTFKDQDSKPSSQWLRFTLVNMIGGSANYLIYLLLVYQVPLVAELPVLGVAVGSIAGLLINFTLSRAMVFGSLEAEQ